MTDQRALTRIDPRQDALGRAIMLRVQLIPEAVRFLNRAVIVIARAGGGAGADGLAAMLAYMAHEGGVPVTLVDFCLEGDEGAAWGPEGRHGLTCKRLIVSDALGAALGDAISENLDGIVIINTPPNTLLDIAGAEREFLPIIKELKRPYVVFWIDRPNDEKMNRLAFYRRAGGAAKWVVGVLAKATDRLGDAQQVNVLPHEEYWAPVRVPLLPSQIASLFFAEKFPLSEAVEQATIGSKLAFFARIKAFAFELRDAL